MIKRENTDNLMSSEQLRQLTDNILAEAKRLNASQAEVSVMANKGFSVSAQGGEVETVEYNQDKIIEIVVYDGKRTGSASISDVRPEAIRDAVEAACHIARYTDEDPFSGLADPQELAFNYPQLQLAYPWDLSVQAAIELACQCEQQALKIDKRIIRAEDVSVGTGIVWHAYANSHGFYGDFQTSRHDMSCVVIAKHNEEMQRDCSYTVACDPSLLKSSSEIAEDAVKKTVARLGAKSLSTRKAPVIFLAEEARGLLSHFTSAISGRAIYRKCTFLLDSLNKAVFPEFITIKELPHLPKALASEPFDSNGVATRENTFIEQGILQSYLLGVYSARKLGLKSTGNADGVHNLTISTNHADLASLLAKMDKGLLITELMGQGVNIVTGDYSRGASGFWVENGKIQYPVHEITVASRLQDMYSNIIGIANDIDVRGSIHTGSILIDNMIIAGN
jgi:PmbA protein